MSIFRIAAFAVALSPAVAVAQQASDLREFRVGMPVSELPASGYGGFACTAEPGKSLAGWADYRSCPSGNGGTHSVSFRYAGGGAGEDADKTQVAGQPVNLALLISDDGQVMGIKIDTDPHARLYMHKKAYLFALQVRARFGEDGWTCQKASPTTGQQPVGGVFVHEHCEKVTPTRHFVLDRQLFRDPAKDLRDFTDATQLTILRPG